MSHNSEDRTYPKIKVYLNTIKYYEEAKQKPKDAEKSKQDTIKELARKLENSGMPLEKICRDL